MVGGTVWLKFELLLNIMHVLYTFEFKWIRHIATEKKFFDAQWQLALWSLVGSGLISTSSKPFCISSLPARMKRIISKTAEKKRQHSFSHYKSTGIFSNAQGQLTLQSIDGSGRILKTSELSCMSSLPVSAKRIGRKTAKKRWQH